MIKRYTLSITIVGLLVLGAACGQKAATTTNTTNTANTTANTNTSTVINTNTSTTNTTTTNTNITTATATVTITSSGVSPKTLTVASGTKVTFVNNDTSAHQIASNPHPTHSDLPAFDGAIAAGGTYSFTFTRAGSWGYHDHDDPFSGNWKGTVVVQ